jgi:hypothetical protein
VTTASPQPTHARCVCAFHTLCMCISHVVYVHFTHCVCAFHKLCMCISHVVYVHFTRCVCTIHCNICKQVGGERERQRCSSIHHTSSERVTASSSSLSPSLCTPCSSTAAQGKELPAHRVTWNIQALHGHTGRLQAEQPSSMIDTQNTLLVTRKKKRGPACSSLLRLVRSAAEAT